MMINRNNPIPAYIQLKRIIKDQILAGRLMPGDRLEPEWKLAERYGISRNTVKKALDGLKQEGYIHQFQGKGTFVSQPRISHRFVTTISFTEELLARGLRPSSRLLEGGELIPPADIAKELGLRKGEKVYKIRRLRFANDDPVGVNLSYIPCKICPGLLGEDLEKGSLYALIQEKYHFRIVKVRRDYETMPVDREIGELLEMELGSPVLKITGVVFNEMGKAVDYSIEHYK